jgi:hypothetical protein
MNDRDTTNDLIAWERLPALALGISQGLNIFLWYVMSLERVALQDGRAPAHVPDFVIGLLPIAVFIAAIAAAVSLDGTMIAAVLGSRNGRDGVWTWVTVVAAALFSAGIALDVYGGNILPGAWLHIAQTAVLLCYMMHLRQPKKRLQYDAGVDAGLNRSNASDVYIAAVPPPALTDGVQQRLMPCKYCHEQVTLAMAGQHGKHYKTHGICVAR